MSFMSFGLCRPPPQLECESTAQLFVWEPQVAAAGLGLLSLPVPRASQASLCSLTYLGTPGQVGSQQVPDYLPIQREVGSPVCSGSPRMEGNKSLASAPPHPASEGLFSVPRR